MKRSVIINEFENGVDWQLYVRQCERNYSIQNGLEPIGHCYICDNLSVLDENCKCNHCNGSFLNET